MLLMSLSIQQSSIAQESENARYVLLIGGLGGDADHTNTFKGYLFETRKSFIEVFGFSEENVTVLGETKIQEEPFIDGVSNAETIRETFRVLKNRVTSRDEVYVILFGHGGYEGGESRLNIPRRDLTQHDYAELVDQLDANRVIFINTGSASAPFIDALSKQGRVIITATRTGTQKNETSFPRFMVEGFTSPGADRDKDGRISVVELFYYAAEKTDQWFDENGNIPTENALISDTGDGKGYRVEELETAGVGQLAAFTYLSVDESVMLAASGEANTVVRNWLQEKSQLELEIATLKSKKADMNVDAYYAELEVLFVRLARGNERVEQNP